MQTTDLHILRITRENKVSVPKEMQSALESHTQEHEVSPVWQTFWWTQVLVDTGYIDTGFCVYSENYSFIAFLQKRSLGMGQY